MSGPTAEAVVHVVSESDLKRLAHLQHAETQEALLLAVRKAEDESQGYEMLGDGSGGAYWERMAIALRGLLLGEP